jgi:uncharacterized protein YkwD
MKFLIMAPILLALTVGCLPPLKRWSPRQPLDEQSPKAAAEFEKDPEAFSCRDEICVIEQTILEQTNSERAKRSLPPMNGDSKLAFIARKWSEQQSKRGSIGHQGFPVARNQLYKANFGRSVDLAGENVAMTSSSGMGALKVASQLTRMWVKSPGHYRNMMSSAKALGVGVYIAGGRVYATQIMGNP